MRFRLIAIVILTLLILVCSYQTYWLINFHNEQYRKMEMAIKNAMNNADFKEVSLRIVQIFTESDSIYNSSIANKRLDTIAEIKMPDVVVRITGDKDGAKIWSDAKSMSVSVQQGIHSKMDSIKAINFAKLDSLMTEELKSLDINIPHYLEYVGGDSTLMQLPENISDEDKAKYEEYIFPFSENDTHAYHLYLKQPKWHIFKSMWGLLTVSSLMVVLLIISYIYLLKFILKQKTIDEIKSDFVNNMTHELKTPISVTYAAIDAMQNFGIAEDKHKRDEYLKISKEQLMYLNSLVEQILNMSVEERKNMKLSSDTIQLYNLFEAQKNQFLLNPPKPITIDIDIKPQNLSIQADKIHFGNIISNLIENAIKYSNDSVNIKLSAYKNAENTIISICDDGIGIPDNAQDRIFDKFYRVSTGNIHNAKGYGLGLFYVKTIVDKHGWSIKFESTEGKGTCFKIII